MRKKINYTVISLYLCIAAATVSAQARNALLIANGEYTNFSSLANPVPEAENLAKTLTALGFEVKIITNAGKEQMEEQLYDFEKKITRDKGIAFFHYGGHAVQVAGENYLIPADANIPDEQRISTRAVNVSEIMLSMKADSNIIVLDSCRNNPLPAGSGRSATRGLQMIKNTPKNSIIVYSAEAGRTAADGVFTPILTVKLLEDKELIAVLRDVRNEVDRVTDGEQMPGQYDQLKNEIYLARNIPDRGESVEEESAELDKVKEALEKELALVNEQARQKKWELEHVKEAERRRAEENKRIADENARKNDNQRKQDEAFAQILTQNDARLKEIERLRVRTDDMGVLINQINKIYEEVNKLKSDFEAPMNKAIEETKEYYRRKKQEITKTKYETDAEFEARRRTETQFYENEMAADIAKIHSQYQAMIDGNNNSMKINLRSSEMQTLIVSGSRVKLTFEEFDIRHQSYPVIVTDSEKPAVSAELHIYATSDNVHDRVKKCMEIEDNIKNKRYEGKIEYGIIFDFSAGEYISVLKGMTVELANGQIVAAMQTNQYRKAHNMPEMENEEIDAAVLNMPSFNINITNNNIINNNTAQAAAPAAAPSIIINMTGNTITNNGSTAPALPDTPIQTQQPVQNQNNYQQQQYTPKYQPTHYAVDLTPAEQRFKEKYFDLLWGITPNDINQLRSIYMSYIAGTTVLAALGGSSALSGLLFLCMSVISYPIFLITGAIFAAIGAVITPLSAIPAQYCHKIKMIYQKTTGEHFNALFYGYISDKSNSRTVSGCELAMSISL